MLKVTPLDVAGAQVVHAQDSVPDSTLTEDFRRAVVALQDLLVRDEPELAESFADWKWLAGLEVRIHPHAGIRLEPAGAHEPIELPVDAQIARGHGAVFLRSAEALRTKLGAGTAIAALFPGQRQRVGHRWRDVWEESLLDTAVGAAFTSSRQQDQEAAPEAAGDPGHAPHTDCPGLPSATPAAPG